MDIAVRVTPNAGANQIKSDLQADGSILLRVMVTATPEDGKANDAVIKLMAKHFGVAKSRLSIIRGQTSRDKLIRIAD